MGGSGLSVSIGTIHRAPTSSASRIGATAKAHEGEASHYCKLHAMMDQIGRADIIEGAGFVLGHQMRIRCATDRGALPAYAGSGG